METAKPLNIITVPEMIVTHCRIDIFHIVRNTLWYAVKDVHNTTLRKLHLVDQTPSKPKHHCHFFTDLFYGTINKERKTEEEEKEEEEEEEEEQKEEEIEDTLKVRKEICVDLNICYAINQN
ncbi:Hypothetical predicted protein [Octopus vulgaris]|uniref:Uncharacterized protein n=1 Tax=Octopus vulgaris TaxID=6645 RepID=A0AA36F6Q3_OCTVU|nr:Hypothetical predicted protein [Octopus vulgaris]